MTFILVIFYYSMVLSPCGRGDGALFFFLLTFIQIIRLTQTSESHLT